MRQVKGKNTYPELIVQQILQEMGYDNYQLHPENIAGKPDMAWIDYKAVLFIHGCFWHGHDCSRGSRLPKTHRNYWETKIERNFKRDQSHQAILAEQGWRVLTIWECELQKKESIIEKLNQFLRT